MKYFEKLTEEYRPAFNVEDLEYFMSMQEAKPVGTPNHSAQKWNIRAEFWEKERRNHRKNDERVNNTVAFLEQKGILHKDCDIADIGCGPGRFAAAFAKKAHFVLGLDISEKMVAHGMEYIQRQGLSNAHLRVCDFQTLDIRKEGYERKFDLVFSSLTPAIHGMQGILKSMEMSRGYCLNITHIYWENHLRTRIMREVFGRDMVSQWNGGWYYSLFNVLYLLGYYPETSYETRHQERLVKPEEEYVGFLMEHMLPKKERTKENKSKIFSWLQEHADENGYLQEESESCYGRIFWDVRKKTQRPDYHIMKGV